MEHWRGAGEGRDEEGEGKGGWRKKRGNEKGTFIFANICTVYHWKNSFLPRKINWHTPNFNIQYLWPINAIIILDSVLPPIVVEIGSTNNKLYYRK